MLEDDEQEHAAARRQEKGKSRVYADLDHDEEEAEEVPLEDGAATSATKRKKLLIITTGTRGDVQPFLALGSHHPPLSPVLVS